MSELTDRLRGAQSSGNNAPKLNVVSYIDMGANGNVPAFKIYSKEKKENVYMSRPILGIFVGHAMQIESFDKDAMISGGTWSTSVYFTKEDRITLYEPTKKGQSVKVKGTMDEVLAELSSRNLQAKKRYLIYLLTEKGLICVRTNVSLAIADLGKIKDDIYQKMVMLVPKRYSLDDPNISKTTHGYLGKIAASNPPNYANIITGEEINEEKAISWGIFAVLDEWKAWKEYKATTGKATEGEAKTVDESIKSPDLPTDPVFNKPASQQTTAQSYQAAQAPTQLADNEVDDLPF